MYICKYCCTYMCYIIQVPLCRPVKYKKKKKIVCTSSEPLVLKLFGNLNTSNPFLNLGRYKQREHGPGAGWKVP